MANDMTTWMDAAADQMKQFTPKSGFNVVAVDQMALPGEALYLVDHFDSKDDAEEAAVAYQKKSGDKTYVYGAE